MAVVCGRASRSARVRLTSRPPYPTTRRYDAAVAVAVTAAARADLLIGMPPGPSPERVPKTETRRSAGTDDPAVTSAATPAASQVVRSSPRRVSTPGSVAAARSCAVSSTSAPRASRITGSLTAMCTTSAPMATQAIA